MPFIQSGGQTIVDVPAGQKILITSYGAGQTKIAIGTTPSQFPESFIDTVVIENNSWLSPVFASLQEVKIDAAICEVEYVIGVSPVATKERYQPNSVVIAGGSINGTTIGETLPSSGSFTSLTTSGNAGIGVAPSAWGGGYKSIQVGGQSISGTATQTFQSQNAYYDGTNWRYIANAPASRVESTSGLYRWSTASSGTAGSAISFLQTMILDAIGNIGIGVTPSVWAPYKAIQIGLVGSLFADNGSNDVRVAQNIYYESGVFKYLRTGQPASFYGQSAGTIVHTWSSAPSGTAGANVSFTLAMAIDSNNNLLVGTGSAIDGRMTVAANTVNSGAITTSNNSLSTYNPLLNYHNGVLKSYFSQTASVCSLTVADSFSLLSGTGPITFFTGGIERARITTTGNFIDFQQAESAQNTTATLTIAQIRSEIITSNAAVTLTLPTGADLDTYSGSMAISTAFEVVFIATTANAITIAANGNTIIGSLTVAGNTSGTFRFRKTAANTFTVYRIS